MVKIGDAVLLHTYSSRKCSPIAECRKCSCKCGTGVTIVWRYKACMEHYMHHCKPCISAHAWPFHALFVPVRPA